MFKSLEPVSCDFIYMIVRGRFLYRHVILVICDWLVMIMRNSLIL